MKETLNIFQKCYDDLLENYSKDHHYDKIKKAKILFEQIRGKIFESDANYEARLQQFWDWYLFEKIEEDLGSTPIEHFISTIGDSSQYCKQLYISMSKTLHSIFLVKKIKKNTLIFKDLLNKKLHKIEHCCFSMIFEPNAIIDGRLIFTQEGTLISKGFCLHPKDSSGYIKKQMKIIRKTKVDENKKNILLHELMKKLIDMYNLHQVYKHVDIEKVYSNSPIFSKPKEVKT